MTLAAITMTAPEAASPVQMYRATYSPDDNKLRLYAASRLDPETYKKVHDAGFRWAPRQALSIYLNLPTLDEAVNTLKPWWPGLFDGDTPRLLACGIRDVLLEDVAQRNIPLSHKKLRRALKAITRSESYLCAMKAGACRYDTEGYVTEHISQEEEVYAAARLDKIRRQNRIKAELQAVLDEK
ncbi:TPA: fertility inhibition protein FinO [Escherichia coli]